MAADQGAPVEAQSTSWLARNWKFLSLVFTLGLIGWFIQPYNPVASKFIFILAAFSVVANDSIQTIGTFLASALARMKRPKLFCFLWFSAALIVTHTVGFIIDHGDLSFGKLAKYPEPQNYSFLMVIAPLVLVTLTRFRTPVSTTFLMLSLYSTSSFTVENSEGMNVFQHAWAFFSGSEQIGALTIKSLTGYWLAFGAAFAAWFAISAFTWLRPNNKLVSEEQANRQTKWFVIQLITTTALWVNWLKHDTANITVMLQRQFEWYEAAGVMAILIGFMGLIMFQGGGKIQDVIREKSAVTDIRVATLIDLVFGVLLFYKNLTPTPMSTTFVFLGVLAGREILLGIFAREEFSASAAWKTARSERRFGRSVRRVTIDGLRLTLGVTVSMLLVYFDFILS